MRHAQTNRLTGGWELATQSVSGTVSADWSNVVGTRNLTRATITFTAFDTTPNPVYVFTSFGTRSGEVLERTNGISSGYAMDSQADNQNVLALQHS